MAGVSRFMKMELSASKKKKQIIRELALRGFDFAQPDTLNICLTCRTEWSRSRPVVKNLRTLVSQYLRTSKKKHQPFD